MDESEFEFAEVYSALLDELPPVRLPPHVQQGQVEPVTARLESGRSLGPESRVGVSGRAFAVSAGRSWAQWNFATVSRRPASGLRPDGFADETTLQSSRAAGAEGSACRRPTP